MIIIINVNHMGISLCAASLISLWANSFINDDNDKERFEWFVYVTNK
jgi:hypothetical protein